MKKQIIFLALSLWVLTGSLQASTPKTVTIRTQKDFEDGTPAGVSINSFGELFLAPEIRNISKPDIPFVWCGVADDRGDIFLAGGQPAKVFKIDKQMKLSTFFETEEQEIYALATDRNGVVYAATSPKGKVYKITTPGQNATDAVFFDPEDVYIWSMAFDSRNNLYVATGEKGNIYRITPSGEATVFYASEDEHVRRIVFDRQGNLLAGTSGKGLVLRIDQKGKPFVLYDSPLVEITDILVTSSGDIYAAASGEALSPPGARATSAQPAPTGTGDLEEDGDLDDISIQQIRVSARTSRGSKNNMLYRIDPSGTVFTYWKQEKDKILSLAAARDGDVLLGTGDRGRLYKVSPQGNRTLINQFGEQQVTALVRAGNGRITVGTSNTGNAYQFQQQPAPAGDYVTKVYDAGVVSQWGEVSWEADHGAGLTVFSRSGNTEKPDQTWTSWSGGYREPAGNNVESPAARFIQFKAAFKAQGGKSPVLKELTFSYLQKNIAPRIKDIVIHPQGDYFPDAVNQANTKASNDRASNGENGYQNQSPGRKTYRKGYRSVSWKAEDPNKDHIQYQLSYKGEDESNWRVLAKDLTHTAYSWDSELFPDGRYLLKITASDKPSNPEALALRSDKISQPFLVDNSGPRVGDLDVQQRGTEQVLRFHVTDAFSAVATVEVGVNADDWQLVYPEDGICDSKDEAFSVKMNSLGRGTNFIVVKATDALGNVGFGKKTVVK